MIKTLYLPQPSQATQCRAAAWQAATVGWLWGSLAIVGGLLIGMVSGQSGDVLSSVPFWLYALAMFALFGSTWVRFQSVARQGLLNFTMNRMSWLLVITVVWAGLTAAPSGAYPELFRALINLKDLPGNTQEQVLGALVVGQVLLASSAFCWVMLIVSFFVPRLRGNTSVRAALMCFMLLFLGLALGLGAHSFGHLLGLAPSI